MIYYLDTEFNGFGGPLISLALVGDDDSFYAILPCSNPLPWVRDNVIPYLNDCPTQPFIPQSKADLASAIGAFLRQHSSVSIIADWPDDLRLFFQSLTMDNGMMVSVPFITTHMIRIDTDHVNNPVPHNAWWDATTLKIANSGS